VAQGPVTESIQEANIVTMLQTSGPVNICTDKKY